MFALLAILLMIVGAGLTMSQPLIGAMAIGGGIGTMMLGDRFPWLEERATGLFWLLCLFGLVVALIYGQVTDIPVGTQG